MTGFLTISRTLSAFRLPAEELNVIEAAHECEPKRRQTKSQDLN